MNDEWKKKNEKKKICGQLNQKLPAGMYTNGWQPVSDFAFPPTPNHLVLFDKWFDLADIHLFYSLYIVSFICSMHFAIIILQKTCIQLTNVHWLRRKNCTGTHRTRTAAKQKQTKKQQHNDNEERVVSMGFCAAQAKCNSYPQVQLCSWLYNYKVYLSVLKMLIMESSLTDLILSTLFWTI